MVEGKWLHFRTDLDHYEHSLTLAPRILANYTPFTHTCHQPLHVATSTAHAIILSCNNMIKCTTPPAVVCPFIAEMPIRASAHRQHHRTEERRAGKESGSTRKARRSP